MKNHEYYYELVSLKIDNMLTAEQEIELEEHLSGCSECRDRLVMYNTLRDLADDLLVEPPASFASSVMGKIELEKKGLQPRRRILSRVLTLAGAAAAITLLLYTGVSQGYLVGGGTATKDLAPMQVEATASEKIMSEAGDADLSAMFKSEEAENELALSSDDSSKNDSSSIRGFSKAPDATAKSAGGSSSYYGESMPDTGSNIFDPSVAEVGDEVVGFIITDIETEFTESTRDVRVVFDGEVTLSGTLYYDNNEQGYWGKFIYFYIDDDCAGFLPYPIGDDRQIWFGVENHDEVVDLLDIQPEDEGRTIEYSAVIVIDSYTVVLGSSEGGNFASIKSILTLNRLN